MTIHKAEVEKGRVEKVRVLKSPASNWSHQKILPTTELQRGEAAQER